MKESRMRRAILASLGAEGFAAVAAEPPLVSYRLSSRFLREPEAFRRMNDVLRRHPKAIDEYWFGGGKPLCRLDVCVRDIARMAALKADAEAAGVTVSYQQGLTLGHDYAYRGVPGTQAAAGVYGADEVEPFGEGDWMVRPNGERTDRRCLCPRSPAVLDYARRFAQAVQKGLGPRTYWLDDDLRLSVYKKGCFCARCLSAFSAAVGRPVSRDEAAGVYARAAGDPLREAWIAFCAESIAGYAAAARAGVRAVDPTVLVGLQTVGAYDPFNGHTYEKALRALSDVGRRPSGLRPGHGFYTEGSPREMVDKTLWVAQEAERTHRLPTNLWATVTYEEETYPRRALHKSPNAIVTECSLALASGCDAVSLYYNNGEDPLREEEWSRFVAAVARARPYWRRLSACARRTAMAGVCGDTDSGRLKFLALAGVPVAPRESPAGVAVELGRSSSFPRSASGRPGWTGPMRPSPAGWPRASISSIRCA